MPSADGAGTTDARSPRREPTRRAVRVGRPAPAPLLPWSRFWRVAFLALCWSWAGAVIGFYHCYHVAQPNGPWAVYDGHTYYTHDPALTLAQSDHVSTTMVTVALGLTVVLGTLDLVVRLALRSTAPGVAALSAGALLVLFSLFGLLLGLAGIGTVGLLVILSGLSMRSSAPPVPVDPAPPVAPPDWYVDPGAPSAWRYWDGRAWTAHTAPYAGRG